MDFNTHSGLFRNEGKFEIKKNCYFEIEVGINSEPFRNGAIFKIISGILKWGFNNVLRLHLANSKWWAFQN